jgi:hypothetical protein
MHYEGNAKIFPLSIALNLGIDQNNELIFEGSGSVLCDLG